MLKEHSEWDKEDWKWETSEINSLWNHAAYSKICVSKKAKGKQVVFHLHCETDQERRLAIQQKEWCLLHSVLPRYHSGPGGDSKLCVSDVL